MIVGGISLLHNEMKQEQFRALKREARKRGIVPGAKIRDPFGNEGIVSPIKEWVATLYGSLLAGRALTYLTLVDNSGRWAEVITPVPSKPKKPKEEKAKKPKSMNTTSNAKGQFTRWMLTHLDRIEKALTHMQREFDLLKSDFAPLQEIEQHKEGHNTDVSTPPNEVTKPTTVRGWLETLPEPYRTQALEVMEPKRAEKRCGSLGQALDDMIAWSKTPQGYEYWSAVYFWAYDPDNNSLPKPWMAPTPKEIAEAEREEKLKKLVRGCRVEVPGGKQGILLGKDEDLLLPWVVSIDGHPASVHNRYNLDQLTPLP